MTDVFLKVVNMSIAASVLVLIAALLRVILRKAPKNIRLLLWGLAAVRLICPVSFESTLSLMPDTEWVHQESTGAEDIAQYRSPGLFSDHVPDTAPDVISAAQSGELTVQKKAGFEDILSYIWLAGMAAMLIYTAVSYVRVYRSTCDAVRLRDNIFVSEKIGTPFVLGILKPKIFLPVIRDEVCLSYVTAHEQAHIRRLDHIWKPFGFLLLTVHWFNPMIWLAYVLMCRDIELACDERVVRDMDIGQRADYSQALLDFSADRHMISACPLAFGEVGVKARIRSVLNYKKPAFWIIAVSAVLCAAAAVCFLTDPAVIRIEEHRWSFSHVQTDAGIIYASEDRAYLYNIDELLDLSVTVQDGLLIIEKPDTGEKWEISYRSEDMGRYASVYTLAAGDKTGYAVAAKTERYDDDMTGAAVIVGNGEKSFSLPVNETTLIISIDDYDLYFCEDASSGEQIPVSNEYQPETDTAKSTSGEFPDIPEFVQLYASDIVIAVTDELGYTSSTSRILSLELTETADAGADDEVMLYRLEYGVMFGIGDWENPVPENMNVGTVYFSVHFIPDTDTWTKLGMISEAEFWREFSTSDMISLYGNKYTAAAMELYNEYRNRAEAVFTGIIVSRSIDGSDNTMKLEVDPVEFITEDNTERIQELGLDRNDMINGYYIHNPGDRLTVVWLPEDTEFIFFDWTEIFTDPSDSHYEIFDQRWIRTKDAGIFEEYLSTYVQNIPPFVFTASEGRLVIREIFLM